MAVDGNWNIIMSTPKKKTLAARSKRISPRSKRPVAAKAAEPDSHWMRTAKEMGQAVVAATLPILILAASEALARNSEKRAKKP